MNFPYFGGKQGTGIYDLKDRWSNQYDQQHHNIKDNTTDLTKWSEEKAQAFADFLTNEWHTMLRYSSGITNTLKQPYYFANWLNVPGYAQIFNKDERNDGSFKSYNNLVKSLLIKNGNLTASVDANEWSFYVSQYYNSETDAAFSSEESKADHAVTMVGYNDDYPVTNFNANCRPKHPGAWLMKDNFADVHTATKNIGEHKINSNGYFWVSYEDCGLGEFSTFQANNSAYDHIDMLDNGGFGNTFTAEKSDTVTLANIFPVNGTNQKVAGINIATPQDGAKISAKVYTEVDPNKGPTAGHLETIEGVNHAVISKKVGLAGYTTLYLPKPVNLKSGSKYAVVVTYKAPDNKPVRFSSEETFSTRLGEFAFDASIQPKESWLSLDGGRSFQDWAGTQAIPGVKDSILAGDIKSTCQRGNFNLKAVITK